MALFSEGGGNIREANCCREQGTNAPNQTFGANMKEFTQTFLFLHFDLFLVGMGKIKMCISHDLRREFQTLVGAEKRRGKEGNCGSLGCSFAVCLLTSSVCGPVLTNEREPTRKENTAGGQAFSLALLHTKNGFFSLPLWVQKKGPSNKKISKNVLSLLQQLGKEVDYFCKTAVFSSLQWNPQGF